MASPEMAITRTLALAGGIVEYKNDPGGITNFGISLRLLNSPDFNCRKYGFLEYPVNVDNLRHMTQQQAYDIMLGEYWEKAPFWSIGAQEVADSVFDAAVCQGIGTAIKCLQRALWAVYGDIDLAEDGVLGRDTLRWVEFITPLTILAAFRAERAWAYRETARLNPALQGMLPAWLARAYMR